MIPATRIKPAKPNRERGEVMVEFALLLPVLVMMLLGTITIGLSYNRVNSLNNGARESARYGATLPVDDDISAWLNSVANVAIESTTGDLTASASDQELCVAYVYPDGTKGNDQTVAIIEMSGTRSIATGVTCFEDGRPSGERRVQISMHRTSEVQTGVYTKIVNLDAQSVTRYERA
jgi:hypothetical protein